MAAAGLEARYRRLLRWYPADHRAAHRDEMLGVLMAAADPGRDRPGLSESADLLAGAARIRFRPGRALSDGNGWRDALAVYSLAGPVLLLASTILGWLAGLVWSNLGHTGGLMLDLGFANGAYENLESAHPAIATLMWLLLTGQAFVAVLALAGLRRCATAAAAVYVLYFGTYAVIEASYGWVNPAMMLPAPLLLPLVAALTSLAALLASAGPRRGRQLMQRRHWVYLAAGSVGGAALTLRLSIFFVNSPVQPSLLAPLAATAAAVVMLLLLAAWLSSPHGKRLAVLFGVLAFPALLKLAEYYGIQGPRGANIYVPGSEALVLCLLAVVIYRTRRRTKSAGGGSGEGVA
jgi:hypothetical protein